MPFGALLAFACPVLESFIRRESEIRHGLPAGGVTSFWIAAEPPHKDRFVDGHARQYISNVTRHQKPVARWRRWSVAVPLRHDFDMIRVSIPRISGGAIMSKMQNFENHARFLPPFHFFVAPVLLIKWAGRSTV